MNRKFIPAGDGTGVILPALFKLEDVDGHTGIADVPGFLEKANHHLLSELGKTLPVPDDEGMSELWP